MKSAPEHILLLSKNPLLVTLTLGVVGLVIFAILFSIFSRVSKSSIDRKSAYFGIACFLTASLILFSSLTMIERIHLAKVDTEKKAKMAEVSKRLNEIMAKTRAHRSDQNAKNSGPMLYDRESKTFVPIGN